MAVKYKHSEEITSTISRVVFYTLENVFVKTRSGRQLML